MQTFIIQPFLEVQKPDVGKFDGLKMKNIS